MAILDRSFDVGLQLLKLYVINVLIYLQSFQHQADLEEGVQVREQVCQVAEEGGRVQLQESAQDRQEEGVHHGRGRAWSKFCKFYREQNRLGEVVVA